MSGQFASALIEKGGAAQARATSTVPHVSRFAHPLPYSAFTVPGDALEREADSLVGAALYRPRSLAPTPPDTGDRSGTLDVPASVDRALATPGDALPPGLAWDMSRRFGHDFSRVRVHNGSVADDSVRDIQAIAYTVGPDIVFGAGRFAPETGEGRRLIAHELAHVVQQSRPGSEPRIYRAAPIIPPSLAMSSEDDVALAFDRLTDYAGLKVAKEVWIVVKDLAGKPITGRVDRIVQMPDGTYKGVELKFTTLSSRTGPQEVYIPLANEGRLVTITGHAADGIGLPQNTPMELYIQFISRENVADTTRELGLKPPFVSRVVERPAGSVTSVRGPSEFETARESAEEAPRSPRAVRVGGKAPATTEPGADAPRVRPRRVAYEAPEAEPAPSSAVVKGSSTALGIATPVVGIIDAVLTGDDMERIRHILGSGTAPSAEDETFMKSWGLVWQESSFSYTFLSFGWWIYWIGKQFLDPWVLCPQGAPGCMDQAPSLPLAGGTA